MENITFISNSRSPVTIIANYWKGTNNKGVILLHMMPATKESWDEFGGKLNEAGYSVLAIDLRGHGESIKAADGPDLNFKDFTDEEHQMSVADVEGAREFLEAKGIYPENIYIGGASIGANLSVQYISDHKEAPAAFALSPGLDYKGIKTDSLMEATRENQRVFLVAADDDAYSAESVKTLGEIGLSQKKLKVYPEGGHGTSIFKSHPELMDDIILWLGESK